MFNLMEDHDIYAKYVSLVKKNRGIRIKKKSDHVKYVQENTYIICNSIEHVSQNFPTLPAYKNVSMTKSILYTLSRNQT